MLCVSIADLDFEQCKEALQGLELAEIRLDKLNFSYQQVRDIFSLPLELIATCRPDGIAEKERLEFLKTAIAAGAAYVDIEIEAADSFKEEILAAAGKKNCKVIISYHNFEKTPAKDELLAIIDRCFVCGAHIAKIACQVHNEADSARIISLYDSPAGTQGKILAVGMGEKGKITRVAAPLLGAPFTFAAPAPGKETAPGQLDKITLEKIINMVKP